MSKIGGSNRVREELTAALAEGRGVTAKVRWITRLDEEGRNKWIHCTPLVGANGAIGVWMVVIVDDPKSHGKFGGAKHPPPVSVEGENGRRTPRSMGTPLMNGNGHGHGYGNSNGNGVDVDRVTLGSGSVTSLRI
jgi:hypothetical protein